MRRIMTICCVFVPVPIGFGWLLLLLEDGPYASPRFMGLSDAYISMWGGAIAQRDLLRRWSTSHLCLLGDLERPE